MIDGHLEAHGAKRIYQQGEGDASDDFDGQFRGWYEPLWSSLASTLGISVDGLDTGVKGHRYEIELIIEKGEAEGSPLVAEYDAKQMKILVNRELQRKTGPHPSERSTRHIELALPEGVTYKAGDHLGILPRNGEELVRRVIERFGLPENARIRNNISGKKVLPVDRPVAVSEVLSAYVDLQHVARRSQIQVLAEYTECPPEKERLLTLGSDDPDSVARYREEILDKNVSLIDLLEEFRSCELPLNIYLELVPPLKPRYYSISSSPLVNAYKCSITVGVVEGPARSGPGTYQGVCSSYLARQPEGSVLDGFVRPPSTPFVPPEDPSTPMIMVAAGTGLAPFRGFLQERAASKKQGMRVGPSSLFFGCRSPHQDYIYEEELEEHAREGLTEIKCAFSRLEGQPKTYVQQAIRQHEDEVWDLIEDGAVIYLCEDASRMAPAVEEAFVELYRAKSGEQDGEAWMAGLKSSNRYLVDVWPRN